jgi:hypothetical protein
MLVNNVNIQSPYQPYRGTHSIRRNKTLFKTGDIYLNNRRVCIHTTLGKTANSINKISLFTNVKAKVLRNTKGVERLVLISSKKIINIHDPNRIFYDLFQQKKIGSGEDKIIQGVGTRNKNDVKINYSSTKKAVLKDLLKLTPKLSSSVIVTLASIPQLEVAPSKEPIPVPIAHVAPVNRDLGKNDFVLSTLEMKELKTFMNTVLNIENKLHNCTNLHPKQFFATKHKTDAHLATTKYSSKAEKVKDMKRVLDDCRDLDSVTNLLILAMTERGKNRTVSTTPSTFKTIVKKLNSKKTNDITKQLFTRALSIQGNQLNHSFVNKDFDIIIEQFKSEYEGTSLEVYGSSVFPGVW